MKKILITGGSGFIGTNFINLLSKKKYIILNIDKISKISTPEKFKIIKNKSKYFFLKDNLDDPEKIYKIILKFNPNLIVNFAAESHVDRSIQNPLVFLNTNIIGTYNLLRASQEYSNKNKSFRFLHVSTDEVYGSLDAKGNPFTENNKYAPNSPYSASKASSDHFVRAWFHTYKLDVITTNCSNNYGPYQYPEKLIPLTIMNALKGKDISIYGDGSNIRDWLYVKDHCRAIFKALVDGKSGEVYNIGGNNEKNNLEVAELICKTLDSVYPISNNKGFPLSIGSYAELITFVNDRAGHDFRYSIDSSKITKELGWSPRETFESGIEKTISWYLSNQKWLNDVADS